MPEFSGRGVRTWSIFRATLNFPRQPGLVFGSSLEIVAAQAGAAISVLASAIASSEDGWRIGADTMISPDAKEPYESVAPRRGAAIDAKIEMDKSTAMANAAEHQAKGPWVDLHAHPGRSFLLDLDHSDPLTRILGMEACAGAIEEISAAGMAAVNFATVADLRVLGLTEKGELFTARAFGHDEAHRDHLRQLGGLAKFAATNGIAIVSVAEDIVNAHLTRRTALLFGCEGADFAEEDLSRIQAAHKLGVRSITLVHYRPNAFGDLQTSPPAHHGLSQRGRDLVVEMNRLGILVDLAHASEATALQAIEVSTVPITISHTHLQSPGHDHPRLISKDLAKAVAGAGGVIGAWPAGIASKTFPDFVEEIVRLVDVVGTPHVGIGTDMDANFKPVMTRYQQFALIEEALLEKGFHQSEANAILGANAIRVIRSACG